MGVLYLLFESASGYALFERVAAEEITPKAEDVTDLKKFSAIVKLKGAQTIRLPLADAADAGCNWTTMRVRSTHTVVALSCAVACATAFLPFESAEAALENINAISEGACGQRQQQRRRARQNRAATSQPALRPGVLLACV